MADPVISEIFRHKPQWIMRNRLLKSSEELSFTLYVPENTEQGELLVYPLFLENASGSIGLDFTPDGAGYAVVGYKPARPGNYLMKWTVAGEELYRYFSVVEDDTIVMNFSTFFELDPDPSVHDLGIPLDYRLPAGQFDPSDALYQKFLEYHRTFGDQIVCAFRDTPDMDADERVGLYSPALERAKELFPDPNDFRSGRADMRHYLDRGYTETFKRLGVVDHCGLWEANAGFWLGMPEFIYYSSDSDCRKTDQGDKGTIIAHQWDFCAGFHFPGPVTWHYGSSEGKWDISEKCIRESLKEAENSARMSGHPAFVTPLYEGLTAYHGYIEPNDADFNDGRLEKFIGEYKKFIAHEATKEFKLVFARSIDIADYFLRHFAVTPRTVWSSKTDHIMYDSWWQCQWTNQNILAARERLPWLTKISNVRKYRENNAEPQLWNRGVPYKDSLSCEFLIFEDQKRSVRFERECPNPTWWFEYTDPAPYYANQEQTYLQTPDVEIKKTMTRENGVVSIRLKMKTGAEFNDYMITVWDVPASIKNDPDIRITNAKDYFIAKNTDDECHLILMFDLKPDLEIGIDWHEE